MSRKQSYAQRYVSLAKQRLVTNDYSEYEKNNSFQFYINNKKLTKNEVDRMSEIVSEIAASDTLVYDALDRLIVDKKEFISLGDAEKERYLFDVSRIYAALRGEGK